MACPRCRHLLLVAVGLITTAAGAQPTVERLEAPSNTGLVSAEQAFEQLSTSAEANFTLADGVRWDGAPTFEPDWARKTFWEAVIGLAFRTRYEPAFQDYAETETGPAIILRRADVAQQAAVQPAIAAGHLLIRPVAVRVVRDAEAAQRILQPVQVEVECELFIEPRHAWTNKAGAAGSVAVYATAAGLRAEGRSVAGDPEAPADMQLNRTAEADPTASLQGGTGLLRLRFDADQRAPYFVPPEVANWRALVRVVYAEAWSEATLELPVADDEAEPDQHAWQVGPWHMHVEDVRLRARDEGPRQATVSIWLGRDGDEGAVPLGDWFRLYHFIQAIPPQLSGPGGAWEPAGYIVAGEVGVADGNPMLANSYRVLAMFREPHDALEGEASFELSWRLPSRSSEARLPVVWTTPVAVQPRRIPQPPEERAVPRQSP